MVAVTYVAFDTALARMKLGIASAELHGSVTGYLCAGGDGRKRDLLAALALQGDDVDADARLYALLKPLAAETAAALRAHEPVTPLLPPGPLPARADAMVDWCRGFLGGLGLTGVVADPENAPEVHALLDSFGHISAMHLACDDDDDAALTDVLDFIRTGVARLHALLANAGPA